MDLVHIAELNPELPAREMKPFKAVVTVIWPYSPSKREFSLLLAEPEFRLRRQNGHVRVRFFGPSAKALAVTGVGIGDEIALSLRGANFVKQGTPEWSIDWDLEYTQRVEVQVYRNGSEIANLDVVDIAPAPQSPIRRDPCSPATQWPSPAFLKLSRISGGSSLEALYDLLTDETEEGHDKKRRKKSYRNRTGWTYSTRILSPQEESNGMEDYLDVVDASPNRRKQFPHTPVSLVKAAEDVPAAVVPPPTLSTLNTGFSAPMALGILTPIGKELASPTLQPSDFATVPFPTPFSGGRDTDPMSSFDHVADVQQPTEHAVVMLEQQESTTAADCILKTSFSSWTRSSKIPAFYSDHETALSSVRFTFGMDRAGVTHPKNFPSPAPEKEPDNVDQNADRNVKSKVVSVSEETTNTRVALSGGSQSF
jgi:hypothetical protein